MGIIRIRVANNEDNQEGEKLNQGKKQTHS